MDFHSRKDGLPCKTRNTKEVTMNFSRTIPALLLWLLIIFTFPALATTYTVDDDPGAAFTHIQDAINAASAGDTILVKEGEYRENITLKSGIRILGAGFDKTTIRGNRNGNTVYANGITDAIFDGFTVIDSGQDSTSYAGIRINGGNLVISNNLVTNNLNGIRITGASSTIIRKNIITLNGRNDNAYLNYGIISLNSTPLITNNIISSTSGVGVYIGWEDSSGTRFINNTVVHNDDSGIWCYRSSPVIKNNIFAFNVSGISASHGGTPQISYNDVFGNTWRDYDSQSDGVASPGTGDISADPQLIPPPSNFARGYYLGAASPCIDAGDPNPLYNDIDGTRNDMGAYGGPDGAISTGNVSLSSGFVFTTVGNIPASEITQGGAQRGLANVSPEAASDLYIPQYTDAPFGGRLWISGLFGTNDTNVRYYRVMLARWNIWGLYHYSALEDSLKKVLYTINSDGSITSTRELIGPLPNWKGLRGLYKRTDNGYWSHPDLKIAWNTTGLTNGTYILTVEAYDSYLNKVTLNTDRLILHIDNSPVEAKINAVMDNNGQSIDECSIINLASTTENLKFNITARHPNGFLRDYTLSVLYGKNRSAGYIVKDQYVGSHDVSPPLWTGVGNATFDSQAAMNAHHLIPWQDPGCAYQFHLRAIARTTDGFHYIKAATFDDHYYLQITRPNYCYGDIDDDGVVDGADLGLFLDDYGRTDCHQ